MTNEKISCIPNNNCWWHNWWPTPPDTCPTDCCEPTINLLKNGDFEDENANAWTFVNANIVTPNNNPDKFSEDNIVSLGIKSEEPSLF